MTGTEVSIIIPIYNKELYLKDSLNTICNQDFDNYEIICIDDASSDKSLQILNDYASRESKIKIIENSKCMGAAYSRNKGLEVAKGKYVIFLDADDYFSPNLVQCAYAQIVKTDADVVLYNCEVIYVKDNKTVPYLCVYNKNKINLNSFNLREKKGAISLYDFSTVPWNRMIRRDFLIENRIYFQELSSSNDVFFADMVILKARKISVLDNKMPLVSYRMQVPGQISGNRNPFNYYLAIKKEKEELVRSGKWEVYSDQVLLKFLHNVFYEVRKGNPKYKNEFWKQFSERALNDFCEDDFWGFQSKYYAFLFHLLISKGKEFDEIDTDLFYMKKLFEHDKKFLEILENSRGKKIALWGIGRRGRAIALYMTGKGIPIYEMYDEDINKKEFLGVNIEQYESDKNNPDIIIPSNKDISIALKKKFRKSKIEIIECGVD